MTTVRSRQNAKAEQRRASVAELLAKKPQKRVVTVCLDPEALGELDATVKLAAVARLRNNPDQDPDELDERAAELREQVDAATRTLEFRSIGRQAYRKLVLEFPPTPEEVEQFKREHPNQGDPLWAPDRFPPALIAACSHDPKISRDEAEQMYREWDEPEFGQLWQACWEMHNILSGRAALGKV